MSADKLPGLYGFANFYTEVSGTLIAGTLPTGDENYREDAVFNDGRLKKVIPHLSTLFNEVTIPVEQFKVGGRGAIRPVNPADLESLKEHYRRTGILPDNEYTLSNM